MAKNMGLGLNNLLKNFVLTLSRHIYVVLAQFLFILLVARVLGPEGNGQLSLSLLIPQLLVMLFNLGLPSANVFFIAKGQYSLNSVLNANAKYWFFLSIAGLSIALVVIYFFGGLLFPGVPLNVLMGSLLIFPLALFFTLFISLLQSQQKFKEYNLIFLLPATLTLVLSVLVVWWMEVGVLGAVLSWAGGQLVGSIALFLYYKKDIVVNKNKDTSGYLKVGISYGWKAHIANIVAFLNYRADLFLINLFIGPVGAGIYVVAVQIAERLWMMSQAMSTIIFPKLSELNKDKVKQKELTPIVARWMLYSGLFVSIFVAFIIEPVVAFLFGEQYLDAAFVLVLLLPGVVVINFSRIIAHDISARGKPQYNMYASLAGLIVNIIANIILIPQYGINGAAVATVMSYIVISVIILVNYINFSKNTWKELIVFQKQDLGYVKKLIAGAGFKIGIGKK